MRIPVSPYSSKIIIGQWATILVVAALPFVYLDFSLDPIRIPRLFWIQIFDSVGLILFIRKAGWRYFSRPLLVTVAALLLLNLAASLDAIDRNLSLFHVVILITMIQLMLVFGFLTVHYGAGRLLPLALAVSGGMVSLIGFCQVFFEDLLYYQQIFPPAATFLNKNAAAEFVACLFPLSLVFLVSESRKYFGILAVLCNGLMLFFLVVTVSRTVWVACLVVLITGMGFLLRSAEYRSKLSPPGLRPLAIRFAGVLLIAVVLAGAAARMPGQTSVSREWASMFRMGDYGEQDINTVQVRLAMFANSLYMLKDHPILGVGPGHFRVHYPLYHDRVRETPTYNLAVNPEKLHNDVLQTAVEIGLPGVLIFIFLVFLILRQRPQNQDHFAIHYSLMGAILILLLISSFSFPLNMTGTSACFWAFAGVILARSPEKTADGPDMMAACSSLFPNLFVLYLFFLSAYSGGIQKVAGSAIQTGDIPNGYTWLNRAVETFPVDWVGWDQLSAMAANIDGNRPRALERIDAFLERNPYHPNGYYRRAIVLKALYREEEALAALRKAQRYGGRTWEIPFLESMIHKQMGNTEPAGRLMKEALDMNPDLSETTPRAPVSRAL